jgi:undecaprenyl-diphosphatase
VVEHLLLLDAAIRGWATTHHAPWADVLMAMLSLAGQGGIVWFVVGVLTALRRPQLTPLLWQLALAVLLTYGAVDLLLKPAIARARPFDTILGVRVVVLRPTTYSFPSGHAASAVAGAFVTSLMRPRARVALWTLAALVAVSRIYVGVHYPLDVLAGALVGVGVAALVTGGRAWYSQCPSAAQRSVAR